MYVTSALDRKSRGDVSGLLISRVEVVVLILRYMYQENRLVKRIHHVLFFQKQAMLVGREFTLNWTRLSPPMRQWVLHLRDLSCVVGALSNLGFHMGGDI